MRRLLSALVFSLCLIHPALAAQETITIVADNWCPYNCAPNAAKPGFMVEIAKKAFEKHGITVEYSNMPWSRAIEETRKGKFTAIVGASRTDAEDFVFPSIPQGWMQNRFYVKKGNAWRYEGPQSLEKVSLGVIADYTYNDDIDAHIKKNAKNLKFVQVVSGDNALDTNVKKLSAGRITAIIEDAHVMHYYLSEHKLRDQIDEAGVVQTAQQNDLYVAFSPTHPKAKHYAEILSAEMKALRASGELQKILDAYMVPDWNK